jgi:hypothetical protein
VWVYFAQGSPEWSANTLSLKYVRVGSPYIRLLLDYTGKGRLLAWNSTTSSWAIIIEVPNSCDLYASCGPFVYCDRTEAIPACRCPDGFELLEVSTSLEDAREGKHWNAERKTISWPCLIWSLLTSSCTLGIEASSSVHLSALETARVWHTPTPT